MQNTGMSSEEAKSLSVEDQLARLHRQMDVLIQHEGKYDKRLFAVENEFPGMRKRFIQFNDRQNQLENKLNLAIEGLKAIAQSLEKKPSLLSRFKTWWQK